MDDLFGDVICRYTQEQGVEDGVLVKLGKIAREAGFGVPLTTLPLTYRNLDLTVTNK